MSSSDRQADPEPRDETLERLFGAAFGDDAAADSAEVERVLSRLDEQEARALDLFRGDPSRRYELHEQIGKGGMGIVYRATDRALNRDVAVKLLRDRSLGNDALRRRFLEEARVAGALDHPGIVPVHDVIVPRRGSPVLVMKLVRGRTLAELLADRRLDDDRDRRRLLGSFEQLCQTVAYAHEHGVVHRDLKPTNVMVGDHGQLFVMDWGLSKVVGEIEWVDDRVDRDDTDSGRMIWSRVGSVLGTAPYMAPEQARGDVDAVDERTDVFGLGGILLEILTGAPPYEGDDDGEVIRAAAAGRLEEAHARLAASGSAPGLAALVRRCLDPSPDGRPAHAGEVARAIGDHVMTESDRARRSEIAAAEAHAVAAQERRSRLLTVALGITTIALLTVAVGTYLLRERDRQRRFIALRSAISVASRELAVLRAEARAQSLEPGAWAGVVQSAAEIERLSWSLDADEEQRAAARRLVAEVAAEADSHELDRRTLARLVEARDLAGHDQRTVRLQQTYDEILRDYGVDVGEMDVDAAAGRIQASRIRAAITDAIDQWLHALTLTGDSAPRDWLVAVLARVDDDPWRVDIRAALSNGDVDRVLSLASTADPTTLPSQSVHLIARALTRLGRYEEARGVYRASRVAHRGAFDLLHDHAVLLMAHFPDEIDEAIDLLSMCLAARPVHPHTMTDLAYALFGQGRHDEALAEVGHAVEVDPRHLPSWHCISEIHLAIGDLDGAIVAVERSLEISREPLWARMQYARLVGLRGDREAAIPLWEDVIAEGGDVEVFADYATSLVRVGRPREAYEALKTYDGSRELGEERWSRMLSFHRACAEVHDVVSRPGYLYTDPGRQDTRQLIALVAVHAGDLLTASRAFAGLLGADDSYICNNQLATRMHASYAAALVGLGQGVGAAELTAEERGRWRRQGLEWFRADLEYFADYRHVDPNATRAYLAHIEREPRVREVRRLLRDADLHAEEASAWDSLWSDHDALGLEVGGFPPIPDVGPNNS